MGVDEDEYRQVGTNQVVAYPSLNTPAIYCTQLDDFAHALDECRRLIAVCNFANFLE